MKTYRTIHTEGRDLRVNFNTLLRLIMRRPITVNSFIWTLFATLVACIMQFLDIDPNLQILIPVLAALLAIVFFINVFIETRDYIKYLNGKLIQAEIRKIVPFKPVLSGRTKNELIRIYYLYHDNKGFQNIGSGYTCLHEIVPYIKKRGTVDILMQKNGSQCMLDYGVFDSQKTSGIDGIE